MVEAYSCVLYVLCVNVAFATLRGRFWVVNEDFDFDIKLNGIVYHQIFVFEITKYRERK